MVGIVLCPTAYAASLNRLITGGYMLIMQTEDAAKRREYIESKQLAKVIWSHETEDSVSVQYHPKGIKGKPTRTVVVVANTQAYIENS